MAIPKAETLDHAGRFELLNQLQILSPCEVGWDSMAGYERERHCKSCVKSVHNLIEHTADEAIQLLTKSGAHVCVRIHRDAAGNVLTKDSPGAADPGRRSVLRRLAMLAASWLGLSATTGCGPATSGKPGMISTGDVCPPGTSSSGSKRSVVHGGLHRPPPVAGNLMPPPIPTSSQSGTKPEAAPSATSKSPDAKSPVTK